MLALISKEMKDDNQRLSLFQGQKEPLISPSTAVGERCDALEPQVAS